MDDIEGIVEISGIAECGDALLPRVLLTRVERLVAEAGDPQTARWFSRGLALWRGGEPLESSLGLSGPMAVRTRNELLREAARHLDDCETSSIWSAAGRLADRIARFEARVLPRIRAGLPAQLDRTDQSIMGALMSGSAMLRSRRRLYDVLRG